MPRRANSHLPRGRLVGEHSMSFEKRLQDAIARGHANI